MVLQLNSPYIYNKCFTVWVQYILQIRQEKATSKATITVKNFLLLNNGIYIFDIKGIIEMEEIPCTGPDSELGSNYYSL